MSFFQKSVLNKYTQALDQETVQAAYQRFTHYFHSSAIQQNIRASKEEQFQEGFLRELFVNVLGYVLNPNPDYNLTTELKNEKGAKKADGAILKDGGALGVIELKGTDTKDLSKINNQAFGYKNNQRNCIYVITSNFEKLRFFINNAVEHIEFNLFTLTEEEFHQLWLCLSADSLLKGVPLKVKEDSLVVEEKITKDLYKDYASFRTDLWQNMIKNRTEADRLLLFKKTQKLLDRFLFIFFAEDKNLLPPNSISQIVDQWKKLKDLDAYSPLYDRFKKYFGYLNTGHQGKHHDIFAYNGGLFLPDELLDSITIDDEVLHPYVMKLTGYDFQSEVDVNILGHIFENSLNEIENITAELSGQEVDKSKTKRKKDGVYYTPKYITKYIVDNTVGCLCEEKKAELEIVDEEYARGRKSRQNKTIKKLEVKLKAYRDWLLNITICDPACGSGAFLNQALEFLITEHSFVDELNAQLFGESIVFQDVENHILEKNIFGVDINEESVEIAKLSLWLRTARRGRKLTSLNNNIKCGNSLIDDPEVAGDKAFNWQQEFPEVFERGGFDVVIGNPPYVDIKGLDGDLVKVLFQTYKTTENRINLYSIFIEKGYDLAKNDGYLSYINPNSILVNSSYTKIRKMLLDDMTTIVKLPDDVFEDATVETIIFELRKNYSSQDIRAIVYKKDEKIDYVDETRMKLISKNNWKENENWNFNIYVSLEQFAVLKKIPLGTTLLENVADFSLGITPYDKYKGHSQELIKSRAFHSKTKEDDKYKPLISGGNVERYFVSDEISEYIKYGDWLGAPREERFFTLPRILVRQIVSGKPPRVYAAFTNKPLYYTQVGFGIIPKEDTVSEKSILALINSKLINFYHKYSFLDLEKELFQKILIANCKKFPIANKLIDNPNFFDQIIDDIVDLKEKEHSYNKNLIELLKSKFSLEEPSKRLHNWDELDFGEFLKELKKQKIQLSLQEEAEWMLYFNDQRERALTLKSEIKQIEKEIDQMVYGLYGLTEEEISIIEAS